MLLPRSSTSPSSSSLPRPAPCQVLWSAISRPAPSLPSAGPPRADLSVTSLSWVCSLPSAASLRTYFQSPPPDSLYHTGPLLTVQLLLLYDQGEAEEGRPRCQILSAHRHAAHSLLLQLHAESAVMIKAWSPSDRSTYLESSRTIFSLSLSRTFYLYYVQSHISYLFTAFGHNDGFLKGHGLGIR